jgi:hypothetical protein
MTTALWNHIETEVRRKVEKSVLKVMAVALCDTLKLTTWFRQSGSETEVQSTESLLPDSPSLVLVALSSLRAKKYPQDGICIIPYIWVFT